MKKLLLITFILPVIAYASVKLIEVPESHIWSISNHNGASYFIKTAVNQAREQKGWELGETVTMKQGDIIATWQFTGNGNFIQVPTGSVNSDRGFTWWNPFTWFSKDNGDCGTLEVCGSNIPTGII